MTTPSISTDAAEMALKIDELSSTEQAWVSVDWDIYNASGFRSFLHVSKVENFIVCIIDGLD